MKISESISVMHRKHEQFKKETQGNPRAQYECCYSSGLDAVEIIEVIDGTVNKHKINSPIKVARIVSCLFTCLLFSCSNRYRDAEVIL